MAEKGTMPGLSGEGIVAGRYLTASSARRKTSAKNAKGYEGEIPGRTPCVVFEQDDANHQRYRPAGETGEDAIQAQTLANKMKVKAGR